MLTIIFVFICKKTGLYNDAGKLEINVCQYIMHTLDIICCFATIAIISKLIN
jgi:hypothetical protein